MSTLTVVEEILREAKQPLSVREIVERAGPALPTRSKTPDTVVARDLAMDIKRKAEGSQFVRSSPGRYTLRSYHVAPSTNPVDVASGPTPMLSQALGNERAPAMAVAPAKRKEDSSISA